MISLLLFYMQTYLSETETWFIITRFNVTELNIVLLQVVKDVLVGHNSPCFQKQQLKVTTTLWKLASPLPYLQLHRHLANKY